MLRHLPARPARPGSEWQSLLAPRELVLRRLRAVDAAARGAGGDVELEDEADELWEEEARSVLGEHHGVHQHTVRGGGRWVPGCASRRGIATARRHRHHTTPRGLACSRVQTWRVCGVCLQVAGACITTTAACSTTVPTTLNHYHSPPKHSNDEGRQQPISCAREGGGSSSAAAAVVAGGACVEDRARARVCVCVRVRGVGKMVMARTCAVPIWLVWRGHGLQRWHPTACY